MKAKHLIILGLGLIATPFVYHYMDRALMAKCLTVGIIIATVVVFFECVFTALRDFGGLRD